MDIFSNIQNSYKEQIRKNKIEKHTDICLRISCEFCNIQEVYDSGMVVDKDGAVDFFRDKGWDELITPEKIGISCPMCIEKWKGGKWYTNG